ncbi:MAG: hypothetical protein GX793_02175 [Bacteroidales bacterium]|jgi:hypothetical protein|nr:hypothetical protein [Bacteroidales bacterium]MDY0313798.1 hypothetical protein [Bacteroidales bacterium]NLB85847.1 hypothetical protein [Bacteroidales bacterium]
MKILFSLSLLLSVSLCFSQNQAGFKEIKSSNLNSQIIAKQQINDLHSGALLVRLKTGKNSIDALLKSGKTELAKKKQEQIDQENHRIIQAFKSQFNFCQVYFFYSDDSKFVKENNLDEVCFIDENLQKLNNFKIEFDKFLIAEFGNVKGDTSKYYSHSELKTTANFSQESQSTYYGGGSTDAKGLIIKDQNFIQLRKPFPYFAKYPFFRRISKQEIYTVKRMNKNLWSFLKNN